MSAENIPSVWRGIHQMGRTKEFRGNVVANLDNPGMVVEMGGRLFEQEDGALRPVSSETRVKLSEVK